MQYLWGCGSRGCISLIMSELPPTRIPVNSQLAYLLNSYLDYPSHMWTLHTELFLLDANLTLRDVVLTSTFEQNFLFIPEGKVMLQASTLTQNDTGPVGPVASTGPAQGLLVLHIFFNITRKNIA